MNVLFLGYLLFVEFLFIGYIYLIFSIMFFNWEVFVDLISGLILYFKFEI